MKSLTGKFSSVRGWALLLALLLGAGMMISACGDEEVPAPTTPEPAPAPPPAPAPAPEPTGPATPENLRVSATTSSSITWTWDAVEGALGYQGQFSTSSTFADTDPTFLIIAPNTSHTVSNLSGSMTGHFRVRSGTGTSLTDLQYSDWSDGVSGTTAEPPAATALAAPDNFRATDRDDNEITLEWDEVDDADTYEVEQQVDGESGWDSASCGEGGNEVEDTECVATGLESGTDYNFRVRAVPASDDTAHTESDWTVEESSTTGTAPVTTVSMGEGDLGVTWKSTDTTITWEWELTDNRDHVYQVVVLTDAQADIEDETPCPKPTETVGDGWDDGSQDKRRHAVESGVAAGDVRLLCVQTMWEDDNDVAQFGNMSWSWAATTPPAPANGAPMDDEGKTEEITWDTVAFDIGFSYPFTLASASHEDGNIAASQGACKSGKSLGTETTDVPLTGLNYDVTNLTVFTSNRLCYRAENSSGKSEWAIGNPVSTLPTTPGTVRAADSTLNHDDTELSWTVAKKAGTPRGHAGYNAVVLTDDDQADRKSANVKHCADPADSDNPFQTVSGTIDGDTNQDGIELSLDVSANTDTTDPMVYRLCIQAQLDSNRRGPWVMGGTITQAKAPS